ncbi:hypothetical protein [Nocardiopsis synnemataformans]|uniref:hypothetical protein n=1 Tax=Nocardiopsis synnemataformans TaxID=61305 RepID=UPI003EBDDD67
MPDQILTTAAAAEAQNGLAVDAFEDALCIAGDYINARRRDHSQQPLTGTEIGMLLGAVALAVRAYQQHANPVTARWDRITTRDENGVTWVLCTTDPGQPVALRLDEEHAEALAGSLLGTDDGEEVETPADHAAIRARIAEALYVEPDMPSPTLEHVRRVEAAHRAYAVMTVVGPELAARDRRIAELHQTIIRHDEADDAEAVRRHARIRELEEQLAAAREENTRLQALADLRKELLARAEEKLDTAILFRVGDVRVSRARGRWEVGISHTSPRWTPGTPVEELHDRDRAFIRARQLAEGAPAPAPADPRSREQLAAATWPRRAARRLEDDAHPTERTTN